jgi:hypothetical protein
MASNDPHGTDDIIHPDVKYLQSEELAEKLQQQGARGKRFTVMF